MKSIKMYAVAVFATFVSATCLAQKTKTVVANAVASENLTTLVAALKAADLVDTLSGIGPFTVFAPTNKAFNKLPNGTLNMLFKSENKAKLSAILTYHVIAGTVKSKDVLAAIDKGDGYATLTTVQGGKLTATLVGKSVIITDEKGGKSKITSLDLMSSNGVIHIVDAVMMPN